MPDTDTHNNDDYADEVEEIEAYCVRCKETVVMENPVAVWTKRGTPGTRGHCDICGTTIFRMGRTDAHRGMIQPDVSQFSEISTAGRGRKQSPRYATFINYTKANETFAERLSEDLAKNGIPSWKQPNGGDDVQWASGVHPALEECDVLVLVLSSEALQSKAVEQNWRYFRQQRKPIIIAQIEAVEVPDDIRRRPRFDFETDYKTALRELVQAVAS
jgi:hypothetical protein